MGVDYNFQINQMFSMKMIDKNIIMLDACNKNSENEFQIRYTVKTKKIDYILQNLEKI